MRKRVSKRDRKMLRLGQGAGWRGAVHAICQAMETEGVDGVVIERIRGAALQVLHDMQTSEVAAPPKTLVVATEGDE